MKTGPLAFLGALLIVAALGACASDDGADPDLDAGVEPPPVPQPARRLVLESSSAQTLAFRQTAEITVRYEGDEGPVVDAVVRFALVGSAQDSTLTVLEVATDAGGRATTTLTAGGVVAAFQVRASADRAAPAYTDVGVSDVGFGSVTVEAPYDGQRAVTSARVSAYAEIPCSRLRDPATNEDRPADLERDVGTTDGTAVFSALPSGIRYAMLGRAYGPTGVELARGCADRVEVAPGEQVVVTFDWGDNPIRTEGGFGVSLRVLALGRAQSARANVRSAVGGAVARWGGDSSMFLNEVLADVDARDPRAAEELRELLSTSPMTSDLAVTLVGAAAGPWRVAADAGDAVATVLSAPTLVGTLSLIPISELDVDALFTLSSVRAETRGGSVVSLPAPDLLTPFTAPIPARRTSGEVLTLGSAMSFRVPPAALARRAIAVDLGVSDDLAMARVVERAIDCETFIRWVESQTALSPLCNESCALSACGRVSSQLVDAIEAALVAIDDETIELTLLVPGLELVDTTGDLIPDAIVAGIGSGTWGTDGDSTVGLMTAGEPAAP